MLAIILLALASIFSAALRAEDAKPLATVEELTAKVADQQKTIAKLQARLNVWTQSAVMCEAQPRIQQLNQQVDAQIDAQAKQAAKSPPTERAR